MKRILSDSFNRRIDYLRISITDRCNLRCVYCMPLQGIVHLSHENILSYEEVLLVVQAAAEMGVSKVRITGGEPLVRAGVVDFVGRVASLPGIQDVTMTTNGMLLERYAQDLASAGLRRVNVHLDTLNPEKFARITRYGDVGRVWAGIEAAEAAGLAPIKINCVVTRGFNDDEIVEMARLTLARDWHVRFIELMPVGESELRSRESESHEEIPASSFSFNNGNGNGHDTRLVTVTQMRELLAELGTLEPAKVAGNGPARSFRLPGAKGTLGFISAMTEHFCADCNRLRLTADGRLRLCLLQDKELDLRDGIRAGATVDDIKEMFRQAVLAKPEGHYLYRPGEKARERAMAQIGG